MRIISKFKKRLRCFIKSCPRASDSYDERVASAAKVSPGVDVGAAQSSAAKLVIDEEDEEVVSFSSISESSDFDAQSFPASSSTDSLDWEYDK